MAIPKTSNIMLPFLKLLIDGDGHSIQSTRDRLLKHFELSQKEQDERLPSGRLTVFDNNFGWARYYLKKAKLVGSSHGVFFITEMGAQVLSENPTHLSFGGSRAYPSLSKRQAKNYPIVESVKSPSSKVGKQSISSKYSGPSYGMRKKASALKSHFGKKAGAKADPKRHPNQLVISGLSHHVVEVFFGTDRAMIPSNSLRKKFTNSRGELKLGVCSVSVPVNHKIGAIERPPWLLRRLTENPDKHMVLLEALTMDEPNFGSRLQKACKYPGQSAFVFVHGFNVSFENAARRTAQIAFDLGLKSVPAFFSWPSKASIRQYSVDSQSVEWTEPNLEKFLAIFAQQTRVEEVFVIAHSMGARAVTRAVANMLRSNISLQSKFREIILAAPDIDADVFKNVLMPALVATQQNVTLYASSNDKALNYSKRHNGGQRAGDAKPAPIVADGLETIDASKVKTDYVGHSYVAEERALLTDLALLLNNKIRAALRPTLETVQGKSGPYWAFRA